MMLDRRKYIYAATLALGVVATGCEETDTSSDAGSSDASTMLDGGSTQDSGGRSDDASTDADTDASSEGWGDEPLEVTVADGTLSGAFDGEARSFLGIPYAKPPVGELRWAPPQPAEPWDGVRDATEFGGRCAQNESTTLQNAASDTEDCLYLNVWTPPKPDAEPYPVMVWIHGGGNQNGSASEPVPYRNEGVFYSGKDLAEQHGVLVVTLNYRLGVFGFLAHPDLEGDAGNQGLRDQRMALQWVHDNIAAFGGDPDNVTLFGESAGSFDVCLHVASPESRGLFHRAVSQSGGCTTKMTEKAEAEATAEALIGEVGCDEADDSLACLREASVADLLASMQELGPYVDGQFVPDQPRALYDAGDIADVPYMLGSNTDEGTLFLTTVPIEDEAVYMAVLTNVFGETLAPQVAAQYPVSDFEDALPNPAKAAAARAIGDGRLVCTTYDTAVRAQAQGRTVFTYNFDVPAPTELTEDYIGAAHGAELAYLFGTSTTAQEDPDLEAVSNLMQRYWSRFAAEGDPNGGDDLQWPPFSPDDDRRLNFAVEPEVVEGFRADECEFWRSIYDLRFE